MSSSPEADEFQYLEMEQRVNQSCDAVLSRLQSIYNVSTDKELASVMGVRANRIAGWRARNSVPYELIVKLAVRDGLALDAVLSGRQPPPPAEAEERFVSIPVFDLELSAGHGSFVDSAERVGEHGYTREYIEKLGMSASSAAVFSIVGDSNSPALEHGDHGLFDLQQNTVRAGGGVYAFRLDDTVMVKHLSKVGGGVIKVHSFNPAYQDNDFRIQLADESLDFEIIGRLRDHNHRWD